MLRLGLCCVFKDAPIKFRTTTAKAISKLGKPERERKLADLCRQNAEALLQAIDYCGENGIGCFRINSGILPLKTHPDFTYDLDKLPDGRGIRARFERAATLSATRNVRLTMHPDQFVVLNSPREDVVKNSISELEYQAEFATWTGVDVINIHAGGVYGDKAAAMARFAQNYQRLSATSRQRLTLENDDRSYSPRDLLPLCREHGIPLVYDVHHHRCLTDGLTIDEATRQAGETWNREPLFHISSPKDGWEAKNPRPHHDYIDAADFPQAWRNLDLTIEVEAKAKEQAVSRLLGDLQI